MTPNEAEILRFIELRGGLISDRALHQQFGMGLDVALSSLMRHLCLERDGHWLRITSVGETELAKFLAPAEHVPFAGRSAW